VVRRTLSALLLVTAFGLSATVASAQGDADGVDASTRSAARELGQEAIALYKNRQYKEALDRISRAHQLVNLTTTGLWRGRCLIQLRRWVEASEQLLAVTRMDLGPDASSVHEKGQADARKELAALKPRIPRFVIQVLGEVPPDTQFKLDGEEVPNALIGVARPIDPGDHIVRVTGGGTTEATTITAVEGKTVEVPLRLVERDPRADRGNQGGVDGGFSPAGIVGFVALGVGGAGLIVGSITGGLALSTNADLEANCPEAQCGPEFFDDVDSLGTLRIVSTATFIGGGVLAAIGLTLVITDVATMDSSARLHIGPGGVQLLGTF
jgi:hypothetical protein